MLRAAMFYSALPRATVVASRSLHSTPAAHKTVTEKVSEVADTVNKKLGKGLASAIEKGESATKATKETVTSATGTMGQKAKEGADAAGQKANQAAAGAREAKSDFKNEVKK